MQYLLYYCARCSGPACVGRTDHRVLIAGHESGFPQEVWTLSLIYAGVLTSYPQSVDVHRMLETQLCNPSSLIHRPPTGSCAAGRNSWRSRGAHPVRTVSSFSGGGQPVEQRGPECTRLLVLRDVTRVGDLDEARDWNRSGDRPRPPLPDRPMSGP
jgi:hypothetical protein